MGHLRLRAAESEGRAVEHTQWIALGLRIGACNGLRRVCATAPPVNSTHVDERRTRHTGSRATKWTGFAPRMWALVRSTTAMPLSSQRFGAWIKLDLRISARNGLQWVCASAPPDERRTRCMLRTNGDCTGFAAQLALVTSSNAMPRNS
eukprot:TRINITY_DN16172_c0_g1_i1.p1 TRINITY_DN16172_c0_g1~~TRINITY_DN16172_c0_g1_i1.p1  ORF type:complete len:149 (-),score=2.89 TRINITY_DN16172_c0_g1_i1:261-707(-)